MSVSFLRRAPLRELSDKFKISARSLGEVAEAINTMVSRFRTTGDVTYLEKNLTREALINAAILYVDSLPHPQKAEAIREGIGRLEALLREDGRGDALQPEPTPRKTGKTRVLKRGNDATKEERRGTG